MMKFTETKLQKIVLLIAGVLIFLRLSNVNYYQTYTATLQSIGIAVIAFVLLILLKDYKPQIHHKIWGLVKRYWRVIILILILILIFYIKNAYLKYVANQQFHKSEVAYQNCLDKVAVQEKKIQGEVASYITTNRKAVPYPLGYIPLSAIDRLVDPISNYLNGLNEIHGKSYFYQWEQARRPGFSDQKGFWEVYFMNWMMENNPDYCSEFNTNTIKSFLAQKLSLINSARK